MSGFSEDSLYKALGVIPPSGDGAKEQSPAASATTTGGNPNTQGAAAPGTAPQVQTGTQPSAEASATEVPTQQETVEDPTQDPVTTESQAPGKQALTEEQRRENAANAARRRAKEQQDAIDAGVQKARQEWETQSAEQLKEFFSKMGMVNSFTNQPITTMEEANAWKQQMEADRIAKELKAGKLTPEALDQAVANHPVIQQAQAMVDAAKQQEAAQRRAEFQTQVEGELKEIASLGARMGMKVEGVAGLQAMENYETFKAFVDKGYSFLDAFKLTHMDKLTVANTDAAKQSALNLARSKNHLKATGSGQGSGAITVPPDVMRNYRRLNPKMTDAEIQAHYNKYNKK